jgi:hypothetical protein
MAINFDYEHSTTGYYHIFAVGGPLDGVLDSITLDIPESEKNTQEVQVIVDALSRIEQRLSADHSSN